MELQPMAKDNDNNNNNNNNNNKKCPVCDKEFEQTDFFMHTQEEMLKQMMELNIRINDIQEIMELTYTYMNADDDVNDNVDTDTEAKSADAAENDETEYEINPDPDIMSETTSGKSTFIVAEDAVPSIQDTVNIIKKEDNKKPLIPDSEFLSMMESIKRTNK
jgi:hypothetical protein